MKLKPTVIEERFIVLSSDDMRLGTIEKFGPTWRFKPERGNGFSPQTFESPEDASHVLDQSSEVQLLSPPFREKNVYDEEDEREDGGRNWKKYRTPEGYARGLK